LIPVALSLRNFLSYGEDVPTLDFTQFSVACLSGDNGHGKSALLDAMTYALWGEARKGQHERKPDDGLLRLGASEMQVELIFDLDAERFRVIRSYRKLSKRGVAQLELQLYDEASQTYRSLSEGDSLTRTQVRIEQLLCMDYETFTNSAFIVQGHADAFTEKNARQRKEILSQILGLERYDRLQGLARVRFQGLDQNNRERRRRLDELEAELAARDQHELEFKKVAERLDVLVATLEKNEAELEELRQKRQTTQQARERLKELERDRADTTRRLDALEKEQQYLEKQQQEDEVLLQSEEDIQRDFAAYQQLQLQVAEQDRKMHSLRELENRRNQLQAQIKDARHEVEQRLQTHSALRDDREVQLREIQILLAQEQQVLQEFSQLTQLRNLDQLQESQRVRHEALLHEQTQLEHAIALVEQDLTAQRATAQKQLNAIDESLQTETTLREQDERLSAEIKQLEQLVIERDQLKEQGSAQRAQIEQLQKQIESARELLAIERKRLLEAQQREEANCPLCGSVLDEAHRQQLGAELKKNEREQERQIEKLSRAIGELESEVSRMRTRYRELEQQTAIIDGVRKNLNECHIRLETLQQLQAEAKELRLRVATLDREIKECAASERQRLVQVVEELKSLSYRSEAHRQLKQQIADLQPSEGAHARLQSARMQAEKLTVERDEANKKIDMAQQYLSDKLYAPKEQEQLIDVEKKIGDLNYDSEAHGPLRNRLDALSEVFTLQNNLQAARERRASNREARTRTTKSIEELHQLQEQRNQQRNALQVALGGAEQTEQRYAQLAQQQIPDRAERDQLIERRGTLRALSERESRLAKERDELRAKTKVDQSEAWLYHTLDEAFGKDGIQALIIESAVPQIEQEANAILSRLTDNRIQISIESLRDLKTGGTRETLDIKISDELGERPYHLYSGGEAFRTNFALRIALSKVLAMRAGTQLRTLVIDEGFGTQDSQGLDQLVEAIQEISRDFDKVLVVTHLPELKNVFPVQINVVKHPDVGSRFEIQRYD
jgi:DNA repair protein SbcC/Rad50